jgi:hypothetical protein
MNFKQELLKEHTYENAERIAMYISKQPLSFNEIMKIYFEADSTVTQRATSVIIILTIFEPQIVGPYIEKMILELQNKNTKDTVKRNTVRILADFPIPQKMEGIITEICFNYLNNKSEAIAIRVFSMTILENMTKIHPELKDELIAAIEMGMEFGSAGYRSRGSKTLFRLKKML